MKIIAPTCLKSIKTTDLIPIKLYEGGGVTIQIDEMSNGEIEDFFSIKGLKRNIDLNTIQQVEGIFNVNDLTNHKEKIMAKYKIIINQDSNNIIEGRKLISHLDLIFKTIISDNIGTYKFEDTGSFPDSFLHSGGKGHFSDLKTEITEKELGQIKKGIEGILTKTDNDFLEKINLLKILLDHSMSTEDYSGAQGSFIVTILESLYTPERAPEIAFRFSARIVKKNKLGFEKFKLLKEIYHYRSDFFHTGKNSFKKEIFPDIQLLAQNSILNYIEEPDQYSEDQLDKNLLA